MLATDADEVQPARLREQVPMLAIAQAPRAPASATPQKLTVAQCNQAAIDWRRERERLEDRIGPRAIRQREDIIRKRWPE